MGAVVPDVAALHSDTYLAVLVAAALTGVVIYWAWTAKAARRARPAPAIRLLDTPPPEVKGKLLVEKVQWSRIPLWVAGDRGFFDRFPPLDRDPLFMDPDDPCVFPFLPPCAGAQGRGAALICAGGNYEFLTPSEAEPVARWLAEGLGVPALVLRYRLLPRYGLPSMLGDFAAAVRAARRAAGGGPVAAFGFSAGAHLAAAGCAAATPEVAGAAGGAGAAAADRPDLQVLLYPSLDAKEWLDPWTAGFALSLVQSKEVRSLAEGPGSRESLLVAGHGFAKPPPTFIVASTEDGVCLPERHSDLYAKAAELAGAEVVYMRGPFGFHGFGIKDFWAKPCIKWLQGHGFGHKPPDDKQKATQ